MSKPNNQNPIVPVRMDPQLKEVCLYACKADGYKCLATWIKAQCERRLAELIPMNNKDTELTHGLGKPSRTTDK